MRKIEEHEILNTLKILSKIEPAACTADQALAATRQRLLTEAAKTQKVNLWRMIMTNRITKFAAAASLVITLGIFFYSYKGSLDAASIAWADVVTRIDTVKTVIYDRQIQIKRSKFNSRCYVSQGGSIRSELQNGTVLISDFNAGVKLTLNPEKKAFLDHSIGGNRKGLSNFINWIKDLSQSEGKYIGTDFLDGKKVFIFVHEIPYEMTTVWVDTKTYLPIRVEQLNLPNADANIIMPTMFLTSKDFGEANEFYSRGGSISSSRGSGKGITEKTKTVMTNFTWDTDIDKSMFDTVPPSDYMVEEKTFNDSDPSEKDLIAALQFWTDMSGGLFPENINDLGDSNVVKPMLIKRFKKNGNHRQEFDHAYDMMAIILKGLYFAQEKKADSNWEYMGSGVQFGSADTVVCRWKQPGTNTFKVIYGNLDISEVNGRP